MTKELILSFLVATVFMGCSPKFVVKKFYIPPVGAKAKKCVDICDKSRAICQIKCDKEYQKCINRAFLRAKDIKNLEDMKYQQRYSEYQLELNRYNSNLFKWQNDYKQNFQDWQYFKNRCKNSKDRYACLREAELSNSISLLLKTKPKKPLPPSSISFYKILDNEKSICHKDCGCNKDYDICFLNCGGEIKVKKICIENCDKR